MRSISKRVAVLCLLLTILSALAFVAHHHSNGTESAKCTVCVAAHSTAPKSTTYVPSAIFAPIFIVRSHRVSAKERFIAFALSVRPPPAS